MRRLLVHPSILFAGFGFMAISLLVAETLPADLGDWSPVVRTTAIPKAAQVGLQELHKNSMNSYVNRGPLACTPSVAMACAVPLRKLRIFGPAAN